MKKNKAIRRRSASEITPADLPNLIRPLVRYLQPYVPGEQPRIPGLVKLNTNENPYPPSAKVLDAVRAATDGRLRLYPNPTAEPLRRKLAQLHGCSPEQIIIGNGSDELLALAVRAFVEPAVESIRLNRLKAQARSAVQYFTPSYSLYPVLADIHGALKNSVALNPDFSLPSMRELGLGRTWKFDAALTFITTPNAPSGRGFSTTELETLCRAHTGIVVLDEAYVDFAGEHALPLALRYPQVIVARTFSKAYSLCFQRVGYCVGHREAIGALQKIRDSYNVNGLGQVAAQATLEDLPYYRANFRKVIATRERLAGELTALGFDVCPSQSNFIFVRPPGFPAEEWLQKLRDRKILVRWWAHDDVRQHLRISIGTDTETESLLQAVKAILKQSGRQNARG
jgi:histidinol-phosphate aminotransferase